MTPVTTSPCLSVVIPVFNERHTIRAIIDSVLAQTCVAEVIVVDDGSTDGTTEILKKITLLHPSVRLIPLAVNQGKGAAVRAGFAAASAPFTLIQDGDLEYDPADYPALLQPLIEGLADVVLGSRFIGGQAHRVLYFWHSIGNRFLTLISNMATDLNLTDMECCFKAFKTGLLHRLDLRENRFGIEPELIAKISRLNVRIYEVAVSYRGRTYDEGKKITWKDGIAALLCILKYRVLN